MQAKMRAAADARRAAAEQVGEKRGEQAYLQYRLAVPGVSSARIVGMPTELRAEAETREGKPTVHLSGLFTRYSTPYPMWDDFGPYEEFTATGSGRVSLAADPDVAFLVNHKGVTMARTRARNRNATLFLKEDSEGAFHDAYVNPERTDVKDLVTAVKDGDITEMSFAFVIPDGMGMWSDDFTTFEIRQWDINRGDVSAVNYGANPYTDIAARSGEVLRDLAHLPRGARREAMARLSDTTFIDLNSRSVGIQGVGRSVHEVNPKASLPTRRMQWDIVHTQGRMLAHAGEHDLRVQDLPAVRLPWFEVRAAAGPAEDGRTATDVLIYDSIGGSFGTNAADFAEAIADVDTDVINLRINSPGGSVSDALAIHSTLLHHPAYVHTFVDGWAASAASVVALAGDRITMMPGSEMMIHDASQTGTFNPVEAETLTKHLHRQSDNIAGMYAAAAGGGVEEFRALMSDETWLFGQEAVDLGLAHDVWTRDTPTREERMTRSWDLRHFRYAGRRAAPAPRQRGFATEQPEARPFLDAVNDAVSTALTEPDGSCEAEPAETIEASSTTEDQPQGRSIALIKAQLAAEGVFID